MCCSPPNKVISTPIKPFSSSTEVHGASARHIWQTEPFLNPLHTHAVVKTVIFALNLLDTKKPHSSQNCKTVKLSGKPLNELKHHLTKTKCGQIPYFLSVCPMFQWRTKKKRKKKKTGGKQETFSLHVHI